MDFVKIIKTVTFRHTSIVTGATILNGILGFIFFWFMARVLGPSQLGLFTVAVTTAGLLTDVFTVGTDTGVVNFVGKLINNNKEKALKFLKVALEVKIFVSIIILSLGWIFAPYIASNVLGKGELTNPLKFSLFAAVALLLFGFSTSALQSLQRFWEWGFINIFSNIFRLVLVIILFTIGILSIESSLIIYLIPPFLVFFISFIFLPNLLVIRDEKSVLAEFFQYNKWVALFTLVAAISSRLDIFLVTRMLTNKEVGIYSVAVTLTSVIPQIVGAIGTVIAPKIAGVSTKRELKKYLWKLQVFVGGLSVSGIFLGVIIGYLLIKNFYISLYFSSFPAFTVLLIAQSIFLFSIPIHMTVIYYFSYPKLFVLISIVNLLIVLIGGLILIPIYGFVGVAIAILLGNVSNFLIPTFWVIRKISL